MAKQSTPSTVKPAMPTKWAYANALIAKLPKPIATALCVLIVLSAGLCSYFVNCADPPYIFWDENYHITSAERYIEGIAQLEPHTPLGLMLIAAGEKLSGENKRVDKQILTRSKNIDGGSLPKGFSFAGMRSMPGIFGALAAIPFFGIALLLTRHRLHALLLTSLYLCENALIVHFRATHLESFQMFFALCALWVFVRQWQASGETQQTLKLRHYAYLAALCGLAIMVKVNSAILLLLLPVLYIREWWARGNRWSFAQLRDLLPKVGVAIASVAAVSIMVFYIHVSLGRNAPHVGSQSGDHTLASMSPEYKTFIDTHASITPSLLAVAISDYWRNMSKEHHGAPRWKPFDSNENGSYPLNWPFHHKTINYRWDSNNGITRYVQLTGNLFSWYLGVAALLLAFSLIVNHRVFASPLRGSKESYHLIEIFSGLYVCFMLLNLWFFSQRVMYLYHYFFGLVLSYILLALVFEHLASSFSWSNKRRSFILGGVAAVILGVFLFYLPLTNHRPLSKPACELRNAVSHVVNCVG